MTPGGSDDSAGEAAERALAQTYVEVVRFIRYRAAEGDILARGLADGLSARGGVAPTHAMVLSWLANCASERRLIRPTADPEIATRLMTRMAAGERHVGGGSARIWTAVMVGVQTGRLAI